MKLAEYLLEKHWNTAVFSRICNVKLGVLRKVVNESGAVSLHTALRIEAATEGKVKVWDLVPDGEAIAEEFSYSIEEIKKDRDKARNKKGTNEK